MTTQLEKILILSRRYRKNNKILDNNLDNIFKLIFKYGDLGKKSITTDINRLFKLLLKHIGKRRKLVSDKICSDQAAKGMLEELNELEDYVLGLQIGRKIMGNLK
jgi:hypothetical protein